jgi:hypothetical protein
MIKLLNKRFTYFESEQRFELDVNGRKVIAFRYEKQDPQFSDYDVDIDIQNKKDLTEEEEEEVIDFIADHAG